MKTKFFYGFAIFFLTILCECSGSEWMMQQINSDLKIHKEKSVSLSQLNRFFLQNCDKSSLLKVTVSNGILNFEESIHYELLHERSEAVKNLFNRLSAAKKLPDLTMIICLNDGLDRDNGLPVLVMSKKVYQNYILFPDSEALSEKYQVLPGYDLTMYFSAWDSKYPAMCWRGSTLQHPIKEPYEHFKKDNLHLFSRVKLCELSKQHPNIIDAGFTILTQETLHIPHIHTLKADSLSYHDQINNYKYQVLIDGGVSSFSCSGWRFLSNSLIFKVNSYWTQWYYQDLKPYIHYIPVQDDLSDLLEKIEWAIANDDTARNIAEAGHKFACEHITRTSCDEYFYNLLMEYAKLNFTP